MTTGIERRHTLREHILRYPLWEPQHGEKFDVLSAWRPPAEPSTATFLEPYTREDAWLDELEQLPTEEQVRRLVELLRTPELKELAEGVVNAGVAACKMGDLLAVAGAINSWIATAEEMVASRRQMRFILAARARKPTPR